jgi:hypothetical protein
VAEQVGWSDAPHPGDHRLGAFASSPDRGTGVTFNVPATWA